MGHVEHFGQAYMLTCLAEMLVKADRLYVPKQGAATLAEACADAIRVSTPVRRVDVQDGIATDVFVDSHAIKTDAVICAVPALQVPKLIPDLPTAIRRTLDGITYSSRCRVVIGLDHPPLPPRLARLARRVIPRGRCPLLLDRSINLPACAPPVTHTLDLLVGRERARVDPAGRRDDHARDDARRAAKLAARLPAARRRRGAVQTSLSLADGRVYRAPRDVHCRRGDAPSTAAGRRQSRPGRRFHAGALRQRRHCQRDRGAGSGRGSAGSTEALRWPTSRSARSSRHRMYP